MQYLKPALTFAQKYDLLISRGLTIPDRAKAISTFQHINYYRLSAYFPPFQATRDHFRAGVSFEQILYLYEFDALLRSIIFEALAKIEISIRTAMAYILAHQYGPFGYTREDNFHFRIPHTHIQHEQWMRKVKKSVQDSTESFIQHYFQKYTSSSDLPIWMVCEIISFGQISQLFQGMKKSDKSQISRLYELPPVVMSSWLHSIIYVRNLCAHHSRIWNRILAITPMHYKQAPEWERITTNKIFSIFLIIKKLLHPKSDWITWRDKFQDLIDSCKQIDKKSMGFPEDWKERLMR